MMPVVLVAAVPAEAGLEILSQSVNVDFHEREAFFTLLFDQPPRFDLRDTLGRPVDSFQYEIVPDARDIDQSSITDIRAIIRGDEIGQSSRIPIRDGIETASDPSPVSGGWGYIRGSVPFTLNGGELTFSAPLSLLDDPSGHFAYRVFTTDSGQTVSVLTSHFVPLPPMFWVAGAMLVVLAPLVLRSQRRPRA